MKIKMREEVRAVLETCPEAARDNRVLFFQSWERQGFVLTPEQRAMVPHLWQPETLRRNRCQITNEGL